jgi:hypothetical protein
MKRIAIIVDIDGTLYNDTTVWPLPHIDNMTAQQWTDLEVRLQYGPPNLWCIELVRCFSKQGYDIVFLTGRSERLRHATAQWLANIVPLYCEYELLMRPDKDARPDWMIKKEIYVQRILPKYDILFALDDRSSIINMWRAIGLTALQVGENI